LPVKAAPRGWKPNPWNTVNIVATSSAAAPTAAATAPSTAAAATAAGTAAAAIFSPYTAAETSAAPSKAQKATPEESLHFLKMLTKATAEADGERGAYVVNILPPPGHLDP
jgi:uncharacterized membrane protein